MELGIQQGFCCQEREQIAQQWLTLASEEDRKKNNDLGGLVQNF